MPVKDEGRGFARNVREYTRDATWDEFLPPPIVRIVKWMVELIPRTLGLRGPGRQVTASLALIAAIFLVFPWATWAAPVLLIPAVFGVLRFIPAVERRWRRVRP